MNTEKCYVVLFLAKLFIHFFGYYLNVLGYLQIFLTNLSQVNPTLLNNQAVTQTTKVCHKDSLTIIDRSFRFEFPPGSVSKSLLTCSGNG